jgi:hypothetical protein
LYGCKTLFLILTEEHSLQAFENMVLRRIFGPKWEEVVKGQRKLHSVELHSLYSSPNVSRVIKSRGMKWECHVACSGEVRNACKILIGKARGRCRQRWEDNIGMDLREIGLEVVEWMHLVQDRNQ